MVLQHRLNRLEVLDLIATLSGQPVQDPGTSAAHVRFTSESGAVATASVEVPKFGEDVQPAIDVASLNAESAEVAASHLARLLRDAGYDAQVLPVRGDQ